MVKGEGISFTLENETKFGCLERGDVEYTLTEREDILKDVMDKKIQRIADNIGKRDSRNTSIVIGEGDVTIRSK